MNNLYEILNIDKNSDYKDIKKAYVKLLRKYPPEKYPEEFKKIRDAYETLSNEKSRAEYDAFFEYGDEINKIREKADQAMEAEDYKTAIKEYKKILIIEPSLPFAKNMLGLALCYDGQYDLALNQFIALTESYPDNAIYASNLAHIYEEKDEFLKAESYYLKAYELDNLNSQPILSLAELYINKEKYKKAILLLQRCIDANKLDHFQNIIYYLKMIRVYIFEGNKDQIQQVIDKIESCINDEDSREYAGWELGKIANSLFNAGIYSLAEQIAKRAKNIVNINEINELYDKCKQVSEEYDLYDKLHEDERIDMTLKGPLYYYFYGHDYEDDSELDKKISENLDAIQSSLTYEYSEYIVDELSIMRREYATIYKYKSELYDEIYDIADNKKRIATQYSTMMDDNKISHGIKRLISLWLSENISDEERKRYFDNIISEIGSESCELIKNSISRIKTVYQNLYKLNSDTLDELEEIAKNNTNKSYNTSNTNSNNNNLQNNSKPSSNYKSNTNTAPNVKEQTNYAKQSGNKSRASLYITIVSILILLCIGASIISKINSDSSYTDNSYNDDYNSYTNDYTDEEVSEDYNTYEDDVNKDDTYIISDSDSRYLSEYELEQYSDTELAYIRNEIMARHGYVFTKQEYKEYFNNKSWYTPDYSYDGSTDILNNIEKSNIELIKSMEDSTYSVNNYGYINYHNIDIDDYSEYYCVYTEAFVNKYQAEKFVEHLRDKNIYSVIIEEDECYKVRVGTSNNLDTARQMAKDINARDVETYILGYSYYYENKLDYLETLAISGNYNQFKYVYDDIMNELDNEPIFARYKKMLQKLYDEYRYNI